MDKFGRIGCRLTFSGYLLRREFYILCCIGLALNNPLDASGQGVLRTIVIDPGHGGIDAGCHGEGSNEKNVALGVSLKLAEYIHKNWPDVTVILTRTTDKFVDLGLRAEIANRAKADLFICIHCNANPNKAAYGTETYVMGLHKTQGNLLVAQRENQSIKYEKNYKTRYDGFDPNSPEAYIMLTMNQSAFLDQSIYLASKIEEDFAKSKRYSRGVKQAGFLVLWRTTMPSLLCETGFLTNPAEEKYLNAVNGQYEIAGGIFDAIKKYRAHYEKVPDSMKTQQPDGFVNWLTNSANVKKADSVQPVKNVKAARAVKDTVRLKVKKINKDTVAVSNTFVYYRVQLGTVPIAQSSLITYPGLKYNIMREPTASKNMRITTGNFYSWDEVKAARDSIKNAGYKGAFIVEYHNGKRAREIYK